MFHWFYKGLPINNFYVSLTKILLTKKRLISTPVCLSLEWWPGRDGDCHKKGVVGMYKNLHLTGSVNKWKWGNWVVIFPKNWYCSAPSCSKVTQITSLKNCLSTFNFFPVSFFLLLLCISRENRTKLKKILNLNRRLNWNTTSQMQKRHLIFYQPFH